MLVNKETLKKYNYVVEKYTKSIEDNGIDCYVPMPNFMFCKEKIRFIENENDKIIFFNWELTDKATEQDYEDYIDYVLAKWGTTREEAFKK